MKDTCNYPDGTFIGIITDIQTVEKPYPSVTVTAALAVDGKISEHQKCFNKPFTNGREAFQNFCEEFDLFPTEQNIEMTTYWNSTMPLEHLAPLSFLQTVALKASHLLAIQI